MTPHIAFDGFFRSSPRMNLTPGAWYLGFHCAACGQLVAILDDPTSSGVIEIGGAADFETQCPHCGEIRVYPAASMGAWQAATGSPSGRQ